MAFIVFLDADVLYQATLRDVVLSMAEAQVFQIRWSPDVLDEMERNIGRRKGAKDSETARLQAAHARQTMEAAFPDALVENSHYSRLVAAMTNDEGDRHVLAAAVAAKADVLVTGNSRHFPESACAPLGIEVQDPDTFLVHQCGFLGPAIAPILTELAKERRPPMDTAEGILRALDRVAPEFCQMVGKYLAGKP